MGYVELHCHSAYSFLDGASPPAELAGAAAELGYPALALTDHDGLHGAMEIAQALKPLGVRPITGTEVTLHDGSHLTLLCESKEGYSNLCRLLTTAHRRTRAWSRERDPRSGVGGQVRRQDPIDEEPALSLEDVERYAAGLVCLSGCARDGAVARRVEAGAYAEAARTAECLKGAFGAERFRIELQRPFWRHDRRRNRLLAELGERLGVPCVATGNVHIHHPSRARLQDAFVAVRLGGTLDETEPSRRGNGSHALAPPERMAERFAEHPDAVEESGRLAERLRFDLTQDLGYRYPGSEDPTADRRLAELCGHRLDERYAGRGRRSKAETRLEEELRGIRHLGLSGFFLLHRDMLELAREVAVEVRGPDSARSVLPPGRGRGSSVSSIVCYLTGLSHIDPVENELFLGRFLNEELTALPDIDLDFPRDIREVLIPRVHERYGRERSALVAAFPTYKSRGAIREIGKALGLPPGEIERVARVAEPWAQTVDEDIELALGAAAEAAEGTGTARAAAAAAARAAATRDLSAPDAEGFTTGRAAATSRGNARGGGDAIAALDARGPAPPGPPPWTREAGEAARATLGVARNRHGGPDPALTKIAYDGNSGTALAVLTAPMLAAAEAAGSVGGAIAAAASAHDLPDQAHGSSGFHDAFGDTRAREARRARTSYNHGDRPPLREDGRPLYDPTAAPTRPGGAPPARPGGGGPAFDAGDKG